MARARYRRVIDEETHARPVPPMTAPLRIRRLAFMSADGGKDLAALHAQMGMVAGVREDGPAWARQLEFSRDGRDVTWELHNEFATLHLDRGRRRLDHASRGHRARTARRTLLLISATRIDLMATEIIAEPALSGLQRAQPLLFIGV